MPLPSPNQQVTSLKLKQVAPGVRFTFNSGPMSAGEYCIIYDLGENNQLLYYYRTGVVEVYYYASFDQDALVTLVVPV